MQRNSLLSHHRLVTFATTLAAVGALACSEAPSASRGKSSSPNRLNVVLVVVDTLRADALGFLGSPHGTPHLDRLAGESVVFTDAIAPSTWTVPSVASLMTSLHPSELGVFGADDAQRRDQQLPRVLAPELDTLAEAFHDGGYRTVGVVNQVFMRLSSGFAQGFDLYVSRASWSAPGLNRRLESEIATLDDTTIANGLFLYAHYFDPHWPYHSRTPEDLDALPPSLSAADNAGIDPPRAGNRAEEWLGGLGDEESRRRAIDTLAARYALEVRFTDRAIGELIATLQRRGLWDDTILVVTSDHGEGFWEHQRLLHGHSPHEELIRVPLLVRTPPALGIAPGRRAAPVGLIDLMPTLLDLAGLPVPDHCRGRSLVVAMRGEEDEERAILIETGWERALRTRDTKLLTRGVDMSEGSRRDSDAEGVTLEFYDLAADRGEQRNLAVPCDGRCRESGRRLREIERGLVPNAAAPGSGTVTPEDLDRLRSLGYVSD